MEHWNSSRREGLRSNIFTKRFLIVERVMGEGIGQRRRSSPCFRKRHSVCVITHVRVVHVCVCVCAHMYVECM